MACAHTAVGENVGAIVTIAKRRTAGARGAIGLDSVKDHPRTRWMECAITAAQTCAVAGATRVRQEERVTVGGTKRCPKGRADRGGFPQKNPRRNGVIHPGEKRGVRREQETRANGKGWQIGLLVWIAGRSK